MRYVLFLAMPLLLGADAPIFDGQPVVVAAAGSAGEGPAWDPELGVLTSGDKGIHRLALDGATSVYRKDAGTNGLLFDRAGHLVVCEPVARSVSRIDRDGKRTVLSHSFNGKKYNQPNDLTIDSKNRIYFSDPRYGPKDGMEQFDPAGKTIEGVYRIDPDGTVTRVIGREVERANGVLVSADDKFLFVADNNNDALGGARKLWRFDLKADGTIDPASRKLLYDWKTGRGPDGVKQDIQGRLYVAGGLNKPNPPAEPAADVKGGIYVIDPESGKLLDFLPIPTDEVTNCAFGGPDRKDLYVTGGGTLYKVRTTTPGRVLWPGAKPPNAVADVVVYGGTSAGIAAAIQVARMGKSVVVIEPSQHVGGLTSGGLGYTDSGNKAVIGGIAREFYQRVKKHYDRPESWVYQKPEQYALYRPTDDAMWTFEPKVAEKILREMLAEQHIDVRFGERLDRKSGVKLEGKGIVSITTESGITIAGSYFIDATYEGDLMASAGVTFVVGREANAKYGETLNGVGRKLNVHSHRFVKNVSPYVTPDDPKSGLLPGFDTALPDDGTGDHRLQAYCYRLCMSNVPANRVPFPKPTNYDETQYELLLRNFEAGDLRFPMKPDMMPNGKTDTNNNCAVSTDYIGANYAYPEATYAEREKILAAHRTYQQGLMWTLANHTRVPDKIRAEMAKWGLAKDEFTDSGHWPHQIYVREARRLVGDYIVTERDCRRTRPTPKSIGMGSYNMDSHNCARYVTVDGFAQNEGDVQVSPGGPYQIAYGSIVPKVGECPNLLVPVCLSSSHIAYGSIRMEPVFFVLGQSAATAAVLALNDRLTVQDVDYSKLKARLIADKQVLEYASPPAKGALDPKTLGGIVVDDEAAERVGFEAVSSAMGPFVGVGYRHDGGTGDGKQSAKFTPDLPTAGTYEVRMIYSPASNRATNVPVTIRYAESTMMVLVNQKKSPDAGVSVSLGTFHFPKGKTGTVTVGNAKADGHVIVDAIVWIPR